MKTMERIDTIFYIILQFISEVFKPCVPAPRGNVGAVKETTFYN